MEVRLPSPQRSDAYAFFRGQVLVAIDQLTEGSIWYDPARGLATLRRADADLSAAQAAATAAFERANGRRELGL